MNCPYCHEAGSRVIDSRVIEDGSAIRRRRLCDNCEDRFTTYETTGISVVKRSGVTEPFKREKIVNGLRKACQGRPVSEDDLAKLSQEVEEKIRSLGDNRVKAHTVGLAILEPLSRLDAVAYLRFASVYQNFESLEDFEKAIEGLRDTYKSYSADLSLNDEIPQSVDGEGQKTSSRPSEDILSQGQHDEGPEQPTLL
ncbi:transcriptional regulator NrdR [Rothia sp. CCM 9418]|uniref:transcriptional regulator NrdR n=1 Tax=unclassified Rothia (in: high G+C Gram-positive bacteria) TaxID=2689056 RepID=UPI003AC43871